MTTSAQEVIAKALWADGNNRIGHRPWAKVRNAYMAEAGHAIAALTAHGLRIIDPAALREDCTDPWECCIHTPPDSGQERTDP